MTPLCALAKQFRTDKFIPHNYTPEYFRRLGDRTESVKRLLEIGIGKRGGSLRMWQAFFPNAAIYGVDIKPEYLVNAGRIFSVLGDQTDPKGYAHEVYEGSKPLPPGHCERLMIIHAV